MPPLPQQPFLTEDFSPPGGGIDFLGMRWVNLAILTEELLPGINNATSDFGVFCIATWIAQKFRQLCTGRQDYVLSKFRQFEEAIEIIVSHAGRSESPSTERFGDLHRKIGVQQKLDLPVVLTFSNAKRTHATSVFAAPLYGPSLRYLGLIASEAAATDGRSTHIPLAADDSETLVLVDAVEKAIQKSRYAKDVCKLGPVSLDATAVDDLGMCGLNPAYYRHGPQGVKRAFLSKLLPATLSGRTLTTKLLIATLRRGGALDLDQIRAAWHTGLLPNGRELKFADRAITRHREIWAIFQARQYQRYIVELFMRSFEMALGEGKASLDEITSQATAGIRKHGGAKVSVRDRFHKEAIAVSRASSFDAISQRWNAVVHGAHPAYEWVAPTENDDDCARAITMLARWWLRLKTWFAWSEHDAAFRLGAEDRISIRWFHDWIAQRLDHTLQDLVRDMFEHLVFAQHIRIALSRFDGENQRLRFILADEGIVPTRSAAGKLGETIPGWTADRLDAFVDLLCDLSVIEVREDGRLQAGVLAECVA